MRTKNLFISVLTLVLTGWFGSNALAQKTSKQGENRQTATDGDFYELENTQDSIESLYVAIYDILNNYPEVDYKYTYDGDKEVDGVVISGIPDEPDKALLQVYLIDLIELKDQLNNRPNRVGIYYFTEEEARPESGYEDFYRALQKRIIYPEEAEDEGLSGTVFAKFVVDADGEIGTVYTTENFDTSFTWVVDDMVKEVKQAVKESSGKWKPAKIAGIPVSQWVVLPVSFKFGETYYELL